MSQNVMGAAALALVLCLLFAACGGQEAVDASPPLEPRPAEAISSAEFLPAETETQAPGSESPVPARPEDAELAEDIVLVLEETDWQVVSTDAKTFNLTGGYGNPNFEYVHQHTDTVPLDQLIAFALEADALSESACCELRDRFVEAPHTVLLYLALMGEQITELSGWKPMPTAEIICRFIASADGAWYDDHEPFNAALTACRETYPEGRITGLLDVLEREHAASLERNS